MIRALTFLLVFMPSLAWSTHPQFFFQADDGQHILTPQITGSYGVREFEGNNEYSYHGAVTGLAYEYGLSKSLSLQGIIRHTYVKIEDSGRHSTVEGLADPGMTLAGNWNLGLFTLRYGSSLFFSLENSKPSNGFSGEKKLIPYIGFDLNFGRHFTGLRMSKVVLLEDRKTENNNGQITKSRGGEDLTIQAFYEVFIKESSVGVYIFFLEDDNYTYQNGTTTNRVNRFGYEFYGSIVLNENWTLIPSLLYGTTLDSELGTLDIETYDDYTLRCQFRYTF